jgi:hypothetical protein
VSKFVAVFLGAELLFVRKFKFAEGHAAHNHEDDDDDDVGQVREQETKILIPSLICLYFDL